MKMPTKEVTPFLKIKIGIKKVLTGFVQTLKLDHLVDHISPRCVFFFCYHRIVDPAANADFLPFIAVSKADLAEHLAFLSRTCNLLSLADALERLREEEPLDRNCAVVTFDDGYRDNWILGAPIFREIGVRPAVFVVTALPENGQVFWADHLRYLLYSARRSAVVSLKGLTVDTSSTRARLRTLMRLMNKVKSMAPKPREEFLRSLATVLESETALEGNDAKDDQRLMLNWNEIQHLQSLGAEIGSHTHTHEILTNLDRSTMTHQIRVSKALIEDRTGSPCLHFAYPNGARGDFSLRAIEVLKEAGYESAVTLIFGCNLPGADLYQLKRIPVTLFDSVDDLKFKMFRARLRAIAEKWFQN